MHGLGFAASHLSIGGPGFLYGIWLLWFMGTLIEVLTPPWQVFCSANHLFRTSLKILIKKLLYENVCFAYIYCLCTMLRRCPMRSEKCIPWDWSSRSLWAIHPVGSGTWTWILWKSSSALNHLSNYPHPFRILKFLSLHLERRVNNNAFRIGLWELYFLRINKY